MNYGEAATPALSRRPAATGSGTTPPGPRPAQQPGTQKPAPRQPSARQTDTVHPDIAPAGRPRAVPQAVGAGAKTLIAGAASARESNSTGDVDEARAAGHEPPHPEGVSLRQRAVPFIDMLKRCHQAGKEVVWGV